MFRYFNLHSMDARKHLAEFRDSLSWPSLEESPLAAFAAGRQRSELIAGNCVIIENDPTLLGRTTYHLYMVDRVGHIAPIEASYKYEDDLDKLLTWANAYFADHKLEYLIQDTIPLYVSLMEGDSATNDAQVRAFQKEFPEYLEVMGYTVPMKDQSGGEAKGADVDGVLAALWKMGEGA